MKTSRIVFSMLGVLAVLTFAYSGGGGAAGADPMAVKWLSLAASAAKKNPIAPTQDSIAAGQRIYSKTCMIELNIHPAKLSNPHLDTESGGALVWKITTGRKPMPANGKRLSETDRWNLVNYTRTLPKHRA